MPTNYPGSVDSLARPGPTTWMDDPGFQGNVVIDNLADAIEAVEAKLGTGVGNPPGSAAVLRRTGSGASGWGLVQTTDITALAVSQTSAVVGSTQNPTTTSATAVLLTEMTRTITTTGGPVLLLYSVQVSNNTASASMTFDLFLDNANAAASRSVNGMAGNQTIVVSNVHIFPALSAASHTFEIRWSTNTGTATSGGGNRELVVIEFKR